MVSKPAQRLFLGFARVAALAAILVPTWASGAMVVVQWTAPGDDGNTGTASTYDLRYSESPVGASMDTWWNAAQQVGQVPPPLAPGTRQSFEVANLDSGKTYYFVIRTADEVPNWSDYSNVATKSTSIQPGALAVPSGFVAQLIPGGVRLSWNQASDGVATGYHLYRRTGSGGIAALLLSAPLTQTSWVDSSVTGGVQYEYSLRATAGSAESDPAVVTVAVPNDELATTTTSMIGFPNPAKDHVTIRFHTLTPGESVRLVIYDLSGRRICSVLNGPMDAGEHAVTWPCTSDTGHPIAPGLYHAILNSPEGRQIVNLVVAR